MVNVIELFKSIGYFVLFDLVGGIINLIDKFFNLINKCLIEL